MAALHGDIHYEALIWRDGRQRDLDVSLLVPGDVVALRVGGVVPADIRIIEADQLECDKSVLTGESMATVKTPEPAARTDSAVAIAIGITPQLLPAIVSVSLSTGSRALARKRVLVKRLVTIEDLGNIAVLFTDKTGTLTEGNVTFHEALAPTGGPVAVGRS